MGGEGARTIANHLVHVCTIHAVRVPAKGLFYSRTMQKLAELFNVFLFHFTSINLPSTGSIFLTLYSSSSKKARIVSTSCFLTEHYFFQDTNDTDSSYDCYPGQLQVEFQFGGFESLSSILIKI